MLYEAVRDGYLNLVKILLDGGRDANQENLDGGSLLSTALLSTKGIVTAEKILRLLLKHGADINKKDKNGRTPLMSAVISPGTSTYMISVLLEEGADLSERDKYGLSAMGYARKLNEVQVFECLRDHMLAEDYKSNRSKTGQTLFNNRRKQSQSGKEQQSKDLKFHDLCTETISEDDDDDDVFLPTLTVRSVNNPRSRVQHIKRTTDHYICGNDSVFEVKTNSNVNITEGGTCSTEEFSRNRKVAYPQRIHSEYRRIQHFFNNNSYYPAQCGRQSNAYSQTQTTTQRFQSQKKAPCHKSKRYVPEF